MVARLDVEVDRIFLDQENPRHKPYQSQDEVIDYLCQHESILSLARDIAKNGLIPTCAKSDSRGIPKAAEV